MIFTLFCYVIQARFEDETCRSLETGPINKLINQVQGQGGEQGQRQSQNQRQKTGSRRRTGTRTGLGQETETETEIKGED
jgi:hypothetical protein